MSAMTEIEKRWHADSFVAKDLRPGYTVRVHQRIQEGKKERVQIFEGLIINVTGTKGPNQTIRVRRIASGVGVERVFPVASPRIEKIVVVRKAKVRRANLAYMRNLTGKSARLKEVLVGESTKAAAPAPAAAEPSASAPPAGEEA
jgi:large subunit ribosomal protein L19